MAVFTWRSVDTCTKTATVQTSGNPDRTTLSNLMAIRTVESATYDTWRLAACLSVFLFSITAVSTIFHAENTEAMRRCLTAGASPEHCLLTVHGR